MFALRVDRSGANLFSLAQALTGNPQIDNKFPCAKFKLKLFQILLFSQSLLKQTDLQFLFMLCCLKGSRNRVLEVALPDGVLCQPPVIQFKRFFPLVLFWPSLKEGF